MKACLSFLLRQDSGLLFGTARAPGWHHIIDTDRRGTADYLALKSQPQPSSHLPRQGS